MLTYCYIFCSTRLAMVSSAAFSNKISNSPTNTHPLQEVIIGFRFSQLTLAWLKQNQFEYQKKQKTSFLSEAPLFNSWKQNSEKVDSFVELSFIWGRGGGRVEFQETEGLSSNPLPGVFTLSHPCEL